MACDNELTLAHDLKDDEQLIDYNISLERMNLEDN
jgi:hypothetical protein